MIFKNSYMVLYILYQGIIYKKYIIYKIIYIIFLIIIFQMNYL